MCLKPFTTLSHALWNSECQWQYMFLTLLVAMTPNKVLLKPSWHYKWLHCLLGVVSEVHQKFIKNQDKRRRFTEWVSMESQTNECLKIRHWCPTSVPKIYHHQLSVFIGKWKKVFGILKQFLCHLFHCQWWLAPFDSSFVNTCYHTFKYLWQCGWDIRINRL